MVYIDPKDQSIVTDDNVLYKAWEDRKALRLKHFQMTREIQGLDNFIETYIARVNPGFRPELNQVCAQILQNSAANPEPKHE